MNQKSATKMLSMARKMRKGKLKMHEFKRRAKKKFGFDYKSERARWDRDDDVRGGRGGGRTKGRGKQSWKSKSTMELEKFGRKAMR